MIKCILTTPNTYMSFLQKKDLTLFNNQKETSGLISTKEK